MGNALMKKHRALTHHSPSRLNVCRGRGSEIQLSCLRASSTALEVSRGLQAIEVVGEGRIQRGAVWLEDLINERIHGNGPIPRIEDGRTDEPHRSSVGAIDILVALIRAWRARRLRTQKAGNGIGSNLGALQEVKLVACLNERSPVQAGAVDGGQGREHLTALGRLVWSKTRINEPEVGDDPHAQQVVAEVAEGAAGTTGAGVYGVAIARKPPILPEVRGGHGRSDVTAGIDRVAHIKAGRGASAHAAAGSGSESAVRQKLLGPGVGLEAPDEGLRGEAAGIQAVSDRDFVVAFEEREVPRVEERLGMREGDDGDEVRRRLAAIIYVPCCGGQDADIGGVRVVDRARAVVHPVFLTVLGGWRTGQAEEPEACVPRLVQFGIWVVGQDAVRLVEGVVEVAGGSVKHRKLLRAVGAAAGRGGRGRLRRERSRQRKNRNANEKSLQ